jgi:hypothetical protein
MNIIIKSIITIFLIAGILYLLIDLNMIVLGIILLLACVYLYYNNDIENFETYSYGPYNYMTTGADPLTFYRYPIYREPYMYPHKFYSSYPYPYMTYGSVNI